MNVVAKWISRWLRAACVLATALTAVGPGHAATLTVHAIADEHPLPDAVITAVDQNPAAIPRINRTRSKAIMVQQFQQFAPFVLPIQVGTTVEFPNRDPFRHHVYSFSPAKSFELKLYGGDHTETVTFDKEGVVALGCNIHDNMLAYIYVTSTPYFAKTGSEGQGLLTDLPAGTYTIRLWHPDQKSGKPTEQTVTLAADSKTEINLTADLKHERRQKPPGAVDENAY